MYGSGVHNLPSPQIDTMRAVTVETISLPLRAWRYGISSRLQRQSRCHMSATPAALAENLRRRFRRVLQISLFLAQSDRAQSHKKYLW